MGIFRFLFRRPTAETRKAFKRNSNREIRSERVCEVAHEGPTHDEKTLQGKCDVIDGDTIVINDVQVRIDGIDAPELDQPCGYKAKSALMGLCKGQIVTAHVSGELSHHRVLATCMLPDGRDLAVEIVRRGLALDWPTYSGGKYREYETADARRKLWRSARRQSPAHVKAAGFSAA